MGWGMNLTGNIAISVREKAFSDVAPKKKKIKRVVIGLGNGYGIEDKEMRYIKLFFENQPNQTTRTLSYTKPVRSKKISEVLLNLGDIIEKENFYIDKDLEFETHGVSIKDKREIKNYVSSSKR